MAIFEAETRTREGFLKAFPTPASLVNHFYSKFPDLLPFQDIVQTIWVKYLPELKEMAPEEGFTKLADLSRRRIAEEFGLPGSGRQESFEQ